ncbi:MAG: helix-turn-helix domain-containing protein [Alphaproteobacteria bacterium]|nr:helix-turn-helix domain-containing protein [Alphaproteobacteria bacterium]
MERGCSIEELAVKTRMSPSVLRRIEDGQATDHRHGVLYRPRARCAAGTPVPLVSEAFALTPTVAHIAMQ